MVVEALSVVARLVALLAALAFLVEAVVEVIVGLWLRYVIADADLRVVIQKLVASLIGVIIALVWAVNLFEVVAEVFGVVSPLPAQAAVVGQILTGLLIGRGAQWFHDSGTFWLGLDGGQAPRLG